MSCSVPDVVAALLIRDERVLLQYRINTSRAPHHWGLPAGRVEAGETGDAAIRRELLEELGIAFVPELPAVLTVTSEGGERFDAYLVIEYEGKVVNKEPHRCRELRWFDIDELPRPLTPATPAILAAHRGRQR